MSSYIVAQVGWKPGHKIGHNGSQYITYDTTAKIQITSALVLKRIASLPGLQDNRAAGILFDLLAQTIDNILE